MRINVYAEELTNEVELVSKTVQDQEFGRRTFYGVRVYLQSPDVLHHSTEDDDRSAITFWVPWTEKGQHQPQALHDMLNDLRILLYDVPGPVKAPEQPRDIYLREQL